VVLGGGVMQDRVGRRTIFDPPVALVLAHPDDEVAGSGALLTRLIHPIVIHVTDGSPRDLRDARAAGFATREAYAECRRQERGRALATVAVGGPSILDLGAVDQEASLALALLARRMAELFAALRLSTAVTHPYEGGHPDHDATAFSVHAACALLARDGARPPAIVEQTSYHNRGGVMSVSVFLPDGPEGVTERLDPGTAALKRRMIDAYVSQRHVLAAFPVAVERHRPAPKIDFLRPPHEGTLWYECFAWGMMGERWRALAGGAGAELGLEGAL
jgi:LmbE family N-acetylglucosaminyl deacetylase